MAVVYSLVWRSGGDGVSSADCGGGGGGTIRRSVTLLWVQGDDLLYHLRGGGRCYTDDRAIENIRWRKLRRRQVLSLPRKMYHMANDPSLIDTSLTEPSLVLSKRI